MPPGHEELGSIAHVALLVAIVLVAAKVGGELAARLRQPPVLGELLGGLALGSMPWEPFRSLGTDRYVDILAQLGALILLFQVGLETTVAQVLAVGAAAARVATLGTIGSFAAGWVVARLVLPEAGTATQVFVAAAITATSVGITARVFKDVGATSTKEARTILGAAVLDDVIGLVVLALVSGWVRGSGASGGGTSAGSLAWVVAKTVAFLALSIAVGLRVTPKLFSLAARLRAPGMLLAVGLSFCLFFAWAADAMGLAPIIGAFAAGLVLEDLHSARFVERGERPLGELVEPLSSLLVPIFFVVMGLRADVRAFADPSTIVLTLALTVAAILGKLLCGLGAGTGTSRLAVAIGMVPRGEVTLIFATLGTSLAVLDARAYSALVTTVVLTTLVTPAALGWSLHRAKA